MNYGENKATDRKNIKAVLATTTLIGFFAAVVGEKRNSDVTKAVKGLGYKEFFDAVTDVLRTQVSGQRGRPALEEKPIHTMIKGMREAARFIANDGSVDETKVTKTLGKALKQAEKEEQTLQTRRALFKPSKRIQGAKRLPILNAGEEAKA